MQNVKKATTVRFPGSHRKALKLAAADTGRTMEDILVEAFEDWNRRRAVRAAAEASMEKNAAALKRLAQ